MGGGGSELLIASVFEAGPPVDFKPATLKKASKAATKSDHSVGQSDSDAEEHTGALAAIFSRKRSKKSASTRSKGSTTHKSAYSERKSADGDDAEGGKEGDDEIERLKQEVKMVRESQLRTEEMLAKLLSGPK